MEKSMGKKIIYMVLALMIVFSSVIHVEAFSKATQKENGMYMEQFLKCIKKSDYSGAQQYVEKMSSESSESCVKRMSPKMKKAYYKKLRHFIVRGGVQQPRIYGGEWVWDYYITDLNNDGKANLLIKWGDSEAGVRIIAYQYEKGKASKIGSTGCAHSSFYAFPGHNGIVMQQAHTGTEYFSVIKQTKKGLKEMVYGGRIDVEDEYIDLGQEIKSHWINKNNRRTFDFSDLEIS